jgi:hypothetical protein
LSGVHRGPTPVPTQQIDIDNKARFCYLDGYWFRLIDASTCGAKADADTQLTISDLSALEKQLLIFHINPKKMRYASCSESHF